MLRGRRAMGAASALLLALTTACTSVGAEKKDDIVIAASLELTGSASSIGSAYERALRLEVDRINADGSLQGRKMRLEISDNRSESATALSQITRFANDPSVTAIVTGACSECVVAGVKVVEDRDIPMLTLAPAAQVTTPIEDRKYVFKVGANSADNAAALAVELSRNRATTVGLFAPDDMYGKDMRAVLPPALKKYNMTITGDASFRPGDTDLSGPARTVANTNPTAIVICAYPAQANLAAAAIRAAGYRGNIYLDASAAGDLFLNGPGAAAQAGASMVFVPTLAVDDVIATTPAKAARKRWFEEYTSRYGGYQGQASFAADAVRLIGDAVVRAGTTDHDSVRSRLESARIDGFSGPIRMTPSNHSGLMPQALTVLVARNGRWRLLG